MTTIQAGILITLLIGVALGTVGMLVRLNYVIHQVDTLMKRVAALDKDLRG